MLASIQVREALEPALVAVAGASAADVALRVRAAGAHGVAVVDEDGRAVGAVGRAELERAAEATPGVPVGDLVAPVVVSSGETLEGAMLAQAEAAARVAVVTEDGSPAGIATAQGILAAYRAAREAGGRSFSVPTPP